MDKCKLCGKPVNSKPVPGVHPTHDKCFTEQMKAIGYGQQETDQSKLIRS